jgi:hydrogenase maturation protease
MNRHPILIIGVGNAYRGDDAVGLRIAQDIKKKSPDHVNVIEQSGDGISLMDSWKDSDAVILIDAVHSGAQPGTIHRFDVHTQTIPTKFFHYSTHAFGVAEAIELARALKQLPQNLIVYGIEGKCFEAGIGLSLEVEKAVEKVMLRVKQDIHNCSPRKYTGYH